MISHLPTRIMLVCLTGRKPKKPFRRHIVPSHVEARLPVQSSVFDALNIPDDAVVLNTH